MKNNIKFWVTGVGLAVIGVVLARFVSGRFTDEVIIQVALYFSGVFMALLGLGVILFGMRKKS